MSTFTRAKTRRQQRHTGSRSESHRLDKQQGEARQGTTWVGVDAPEHPSPKRSFRGIEGHEYILTGETTKRCEHPEEFADYIEAEARFRSWYKKKTTRRGTVVEMKRRVETPVEVPTTSFSPWLSDWTAAAISSGCDPRPKLAVIRNHWLQSARVNLAGERYLLGYAFHADTDDLHFDLVCSRQDGKGGRVGKPGLRLVGPWCIGTERQVRAGAQINSEKQDQLRRSIANFRHRYGADAKPLDILLARALDHAAEQVLGAELKPFMDAYAARVPELERQHLEAKMQALDNAKEKLAQQVASLPASPRGPEVLPVQPMPSRSIG